MLLFTTLIAGSFSLGGMVANQIDPGALMAARFLFAAILIGGIVVAQGNMKRSKFVSPWRYLLLGGLFAIYFVTMFEGLKTATPVSIAAVFTLTPFMAAIFGWLLLKQVTNLLMAVALAIGAVGAIWVIFRGDLGALVGLDIGRGEWIYFFGCIAHALYIPLVRKLSRGEPQLVMTFGTLMAGFLVLAVWSGLEIVATPWLSLPPFVWFTLFYLAFVASAATLFLLQYASMRLPSAKVMAYTYLVPVWVIVLEGAIGHGWPAPMILVGVGLVATSLLLLLKE
jgi:drug/metabolite transporter (DMT)-like permease